MTAYRTIDGSSAPTADAAERSRSADGQASRGESKAGRAVVLKADPRSKRRQDVQEPRQRGQPRPRRQGIRADALRLYEMFMGPLEAVKPWSMDGVSGVRNFLDRVWRMIVDDRAEGVTLNPAVQDVEPTAEQLRVLHKTIRAVTEDLNKLSFNTAIARMMEFTNFFLKAEVRPQAALEKFVLLLRPMHRIWPRSCGRRWATPTRWPTSPGRPSTSSSSRRTRSRFPSSSTARSARIEVPADADAAALEAAARANPRVVELLEGKTIVKTIVVPGRMVNFVVK